MIYTAVFTPYVAAFLLNEQDYQQASNNQNYKDPIFVIDLLGEQSGKSIAMQIGNKFEKGGQGRGLRSMERVFFLFVPSRWDLWPRRRQKGEGRGRRRFMETVNRRKRGGERGRREGDLGRKSGGGIRQQRSYFQEQFETKVGFPF